jgi:hypothetical protein
MNCSGPSFKRIAGRDPGPRYALAVVDVSAIVVLGA